MSKHKYTKYHETSLKAAIAYLRQRKLYCLEFPFKPTDAARTDVTATMTRYRQQMDGMQMTRQQMDGMQMMRKIK